MSRQTVKYVGFYDLPGNKPTRVANLAATNKMDYICSAIVRAGFDVEIVSPSWISMDERTGFIKQETVSLSDHLRVTFCPSWGTTNKFARNIKIAFSLLWLTFFILRNVKKKEKILVYHTPWLSMPILFSKLIHNYHLILEVEEIYGKVWSIRRLFSLWEKNLIRIADDYIFASLLLATMLDRNDSIVVLGPYLTPSALDHIVEKRNRNTIKIIYAGSIDETKGGAFNAVNVAQHLPENYLVEIVGFGDDMSIEKLKRLISAQTSEADKATCRFLGIKTGIDFSQLLLEEDIAINPQIVGKYMETAFPSKIITYLSHNLRVVSTPVESIKKSSICQLVSFSEDDSAEAVAKEIMSIDLSEPFAGREKIKELNKEFIHDIGLLLR